MLTAMTQPRSTFFEEKSFSVVAGGTAGLVSTCITNPFDVLRSRLAASRSATGQANKSLLLHARLLIANGFFRGVTAGLSVNLASSVPSNAIYLSSYRNLSRLCKAYFGDLSFAPPIVAACGAVACTNATLAPLFTVRTRCQIDSSAKPIAVAKSIIMKEGPRGFYRGAATNAAGRMVEEATFWFLYENAKYLTNQGNMTSSGVMWGSFGVVGLSSLSKIVGSGIAYPYNVIMTHLREVDKVTGQHAHTKFLPTVKYIFAQDGVSGFYRGVTPHLIRCALSKATQVWSFELIMHTCEPLYRKS